jgi:hypothetical protein
MINELTATVSVILLGLAIGSLLECKMRRMTIKYFAGAGCHPVDCVGAINLLKIQAEV